jgi:hypothetical protein
MALGPGKECFQDLPAGQPPSEWHAARGVLFITEEGAEESHAS